MIVIDVFSSGVYYAKNEVRCSDGLLIGKDEINALI